MQTLVGLFVAFAIVGSIMLVLEWRWPALRGQPIVRRGLALDLAYWLFTPLATQAISRAGVILAVVVLTLVLGWPREPAHLLAGFGPIGAQPLWLQGLEMIVFLDFIGYWLHRLFHARPLWPFHAIHHSSEELDWLSAVRVHPVNDLVNRVVPAVALLLAGFKADVLAGALPFFAIYAILLHANVDWGFGPFGRIIASPRFHRWHHTSEAEGRDRNFAGLLPIWDILFGTFHMPQHTPQRFGIDDPVPRTLWGQLAWPFRRRRRSS